MGGRIDYLCALGGTATGPIESGQAKAISLLTADRSRCSRRFNLQGAGIAGVDSYFWTGFFFPKNTPDAIVQTL